MIRLADVWRMKSVHSPSATPASAARRATWSVMSRSPRRGARTVRTRVVTAAMLGILEEFFELEFRVPGGLVRQLDLELLSLRQVPGQGADDPVTERVLPQVRAGVPHDPRPVEGRRARDENRVVLLE